MTGGRCIASHIVPPLHNSQVVFLMQRTVMRRAATGKCGRTSAEGDGREFVGNCDGSKIFCLFFFFLCCNNTCDLRRWWDDEIKIMTIMNVDANSIGIWWCPANFASFFLFCSCRRRFFLRFFFFESVTHWKYCRSISFFLFVGSRATWGGYTNSS